MTASTLRPKPRRLSKKQQLELVEESFRRFAKTLPAPKCELYYETPYQLLVSVVLSAQTTDKMVNKCMTPIYKKGFTPEIAVEWGAETFLSHIRSIGLAPTKSRHVAKLSQILLDSFGGDVPNNRESLEALPGVGRKSANVVLGEIFGEPTIAVDTHVYRVTKRLALHNESTPLKAERVLLERIDPKHLPTGHHWFVLHGRYVCKSQRPLCSDCILNDICPSL